MPPGNLCSSRPGTLPPCRGTGYRGRLGVFELLEMSDPLRAALSRRAEPQELRALRRELRSVLTRTERTLGLVSLRSLGLREV